MLGIDIIRFLLSLLSIFYSIVILVIGRMGILGKTCNILAIWWHIAYNIHHFH
jgi:hypothetical protein